MIKHPCRRRSQRRGSPVAESRTLFFCLAAVLVLAGCSKTEDDWERAGLDNETVIKIEVHPTDSGTLIAATQDGVFISTNGGDDWSSRSEGIATRLIQDVAFDPFDPRILYAATITDTATADPGGVYKSIDSGNTWQLVGVGPLLIDARAVELDPGLPNRVFAATGLGIYRSEDGGMGWTRVGEEIPDSRLVQVDPNQSNHLLASNDGLIFGSFDGGLTWTEQVVGLGGGQIRALEFDPQIPNVVYSAIFGSVIHRSTDGGVTWAPFSPLDIGSSWLSVASSPADPQTILAGRNGSVYRTTDGGETWEANLFGLGLKTVFDLTFDPSRPARVYAATNGAGVYVQEIN